jgi:exopolysaccharide biosynthesis polyprenyl glycosylphosphotransferase
LDAVSDSNLITSEDDRALLAQLGERADDGDGNVGHAHNGAAVALALYPDIESVAAAAPLARLHERAHAGSHSLYRRTLVAVDALAVATAVATAASLTGGHNVAGELLPAIALLLAIAQLAGLYRRDEQLVHKTTLEETPRLFQVATLYTLLTYLTFGSDLEPHQVIVLWGSLFSLMLIGRSLDRCLVRRLAPAERCLVVGDARAAAVLQRKFEVSFSLKATVIGLVSFADLPNLTDTLRRLDVDRVIVAPGGSDETLEAVRAVRAQGIKLSVLAPLLEAAGSSFEVDDVDGVMLMGIRAPGLTRFAQALKRTMDIIGALAGLLLLGPLLIGIAIAIKLDAPGPVLYRQRRVGRVSHEFWMLKFRSMVDGADAKKTDLLALNETEGLFKIADDPRVTRVGRLLRRSSLDELPQLWNVLRGEMTLVGPRPLVPDDDVKIQGCWRERLNVTPGMTGVWQILGSTRVPMDEMVKLDCLYAATWSLWLDVKILLRTVAYVANRRSA